MRLSECQIGKSVQILSVNGDGALRQHFLDMGLIPGALVTVVKYAPMGDPIEVKVHGYELSLRLDDAENIVVSNNCQQAQSHDFIEMSDIEHPGLGEGGRFHDKKTEVALAADEVLTFALVGNQNCGKTTLFNQLTGSNQHVGNFPGVTVDRKDGIIKGNQQTLITDLPGIYSLSPYTAEEVVTRQFIFENHPKGIINIVDATNIERNLYLTMQLLELDIPMVIALNMMDELRNNDGSVKVSELEALLGVPVIPISAAKNQGVDELVAHALHVAKYQEKPLKQDFCAVGSSLHRGIHATMEFIRNDCLNHDLPVRFTATKVMEKDNAMVSQLDLSETQLKIVDDIREQVKEECGMDICAAVATMRFDYIVAITQKTVIKPKESIERLRSKRIDKVLTGKYTGIPLFALIMGIVFYLTFNVIGAFLQGVLENIIAYITVFVDQWLTGLHVSTVLHSLIIDGIFNGVGGVLSFLPIIVTLFFFLSLLEDSGYMARVAFIMDKLLRKIGLSGRSIVPMLIGFGCTVPAVMATRTLPSQRDRKLTILLTPFMSCSAKMPIYAFLSAAFFPQHRALVMLGLYFGGILMAILIALLTKVTTFKGEAVPFVMELPNYRLPTFKNIMQLLGDKVKDFTQRAFTVIFLATIVIWFTQNFDFGLNMVSDSSQSILATLAGIIAPLLAPLGLNDWRIAVALVSGFMAKESVVSTLSILYGSVAVLQTSLSWVSALSLLVFALLYTPCVAAIAAVKEELGGKNALLMVIGQCAIAWVMALLVRYVCLIIV